MLRKKGPLACDPYKILATLQRRKAVGNMNLRDVKIPSRADMGNVARMLQEQIEEILGAATFTDSSIAEDLCKRKRSEVEDNAGGYIIRNILG